MSRIVLLVFITLLGAVLLAACGPAKAEDQTNANGPVTVSVTLTEFAIKSTTTQFKPGMQYHFIVKNEGQIAHEFMIMPESAMMGMEDMTMENLDQLAYMMIPQAQLPPGASATMDYTFTETPKESVEMVCTLAGHLEAGMRATITVK